ncbi:HlyC/CorC family transporter [Sediminibacterium roseum]|uniref:HlyC/CorC family transporter n=1 Tax=Sediminibacterium roseum TaxID=1978412 RepID=A0ABW9ZU33_9BACT|nr:hemolysin family protein [Sediminibacterium roseum]NCI49774.1 HlyC/CorC family transporter [Sediminibacterium roseum]
MTEIIILIILILINGLFSMSEIALVSARKARLEAQAAKGDGEAKRALALANHPETFLSTVQIGITLIGVLTGIYSGDSFKEPLTAWLQKFDFLKDYASSVATTLIVVVLTYLSLVLGELVPKRIGLSNPEKIAKKVAGPMRIVTWVTFPFTWALSITANFIIRLFNVKTSDNQVTEEEIKAIISEGTEHGAIEEAEQDIIERVFHLSDRNITSLMTHRSDITWIDGNKTVGSIKAELENVLHSVYPVCEDNIDHIKGVVSIKDLFAADPSTTVFSIMNKAMYVPENITAYQVLEKFKETKMHECFIVDEYGTVKGLMTLNDILEAIVGDIPQEEDDPYEITERADGSYLVDAQIPFYTFLTRFNRTEWMMEGDQDFDTLAGFIIHQLEKIPVTGDTLTWKIFTFEIVDMDNHRIDKILVTAKEKRRMDNDDDED